MPLTNVIAIQFEHVLAIPNAGAISTWAPVSKILKRALGQVDAGQGLMVITINDTTAVTTWLTAHGISADVEVTLDPTSCDEYWSDQVVSIQSDTGEYKASPSLA
jgi:hypothetical protein